MWSDCGRSAAKSWIRDCLTFAAAFPEALLGYDLLAGPLNTQS